MFWTRLASGTVLVILFIGILWVGGWLTCWSMCLLSLIGVFELMRVYKLEKSALAILAYLATIVYYTMLFIGKTDLLMPVYVLAFPNFRDKDMMAAFLSFYYVSVCLSYVYRLRDIKDGGYFIILVFLCSWGNDTLAYATGRLIGKLKQAHVIQRRRVFFAGERIVAQEAVAAAVAGAGRVVRGSVRWEALRGGFDRAGVRATAAARFAEHTV